MKPLEAISYLAGQVSAISAGYFLGTEYGFAIGWATFWVIGLLVDIRSRIKPYWGL